MPRRRLDGQRLVGVFLLGCIVFNYPVIAVFDRMLTVGDWPALFSWLMLSWLVLILLLGWVVEAPEKDREP